jgi:cytochrome P450
MSETLSDQEHVTEFDNSAVEDAMNAEHIQIARPEWDVFGDPTKTAIEDLHIWDGRLFQSGLQTEWFARLRKEAPIHYFENGPSGGFWAITKYDHIMEVDTQHKVFSSDTNITLGDADEHFLPTMFIAKDQPDHTAQRKAAMPTVSRKRMPDLETLIRERVAEVLDGLPVGETFNWVERVSRDLTIKMLATLFDMPWEDRNLLSLWSDTSTESELMGSFDVRPMEERMQTLFGCLQYFQKLWGERVGGDGWDFVSMLANNPQTQGMVTDPFDFMGNLMLLIVGGNDTTRNTMTASIQLMDKHPEQLAKLKADPSLMKNMVDEVIRYHTPLPHMRRTAVQDIDFHGHKIKKGDRVVMWYISGNRDAEVFENPDQFDITRPNANRHMAFGFGIHRFMGNHIADLQLWVTP